MISNSNNKDCKPACTPFYSQRKHRTLCRQINRDYYYTSPHAQRIHLSLCEQLILPCIIDKICLLIPCTLDLDRKMISAMMNILKYKTGTLLDMFEW